MEATLDVQALKPALQSFADFCGAPYAQLMIADGKRTLLQSNFSGELDPEILDREADYQHINPRVAAIPFMREKKATRDKDFITRENALRDQTYQELIFAAGLGHFSGVPVINSRSMTAGLALHRPWSDEPFSDEEVRRHELAAQACEGVFHFANSVEFRHARSALDLLGDLRPAAVLDGSGRILEINAAFEQMIAREQLPWRKNMLLYFADPLAQNALFAGLLARNGQFIARDEETKDARFGCRLFPLPQFGFFGFHRGCAAITIVDLHATPRIDPANLRAAFDLTPSEAEVCILLAQGLTIQEITTRRKVEITTTRSLLKRALAKTGTRRQAELVKLIMNLHRI